MDGLLQDGPGVQEASLRARRCDCGAAGSQPSPREAA